MSARSFEGFGASVVEVLELEWREVVDRAVRAFGVEPRHPCRGRGLDLSDVAPRALVMDQLGLVQPDLGLRERVVVRITHRSDGWVDAFLDEPVGEGDRGVDAARVRVVGQPGEARDAFAPPCEERHLEAVQHERRRHARGGPPADDPARVRVEHERDVHPPRPRPHVREVSAQSWFVRNRRKCRSTRSLGRVSRGSTSAGCLRLPRTTPPIPRSRINRSTVHRAI